MALKIQTGHYILGDVKEVEGDAVTFVASDGREMFEVRAGKDGRSIEVRGVRSTLVGGVVYTERLSIDPAASNSVIVRVRPYNEG